VAEAPEQAPAGPSGLAGRAIEGWALLGGILLLGIALMTTWSAFTGWVFSKPLPGDFELTEMLVAISVFSMLPYCQLTNANVTADIFTARAGPRAVAGFRLLGALLALGVALVLLWRVWAGMQDYRQFIETTAILKIPIWWAYVPAVASLALLALACLIVLRDCWRDLVRS